MGSQICSNTRFVTDSVSSSMARARVQSDVSEHSAEECLAVSTNGEAGYSVPGVDASVYKEAKSILLI